MDRDLATDRPEFDYGLIVCDGFDAVLRGGDGNLQTSPRDLVSQAFHAGRVLIQAKGGSGKTTVLSRLASTAVEAGIEVSRLDALIWADSYEVMKSSFSVTKSPLSLSSPSLLEGGFRTTSRTLLLIDGLNEISPGLGQVLLNEVDNLASQMPNLAVIVTDRLHRRRVANTQWILATLSPVSAEKIEELLGDTALNSDTSLRLPYYLDLALEGERGSRSEQHRTYLLKHGGVGSDWLSSLGTAAYSQYESNGDRGVDRRALILALGQSAVERLESAGTLVIEPSCRFTHHLLHDYLAATHVATHPELWDSEGLDVLTFRANSMDALAMVLEQASEYADTLVRHVYDWNFYAAASLIAEDRQSGSHVSQAMEFAVLTMLGERRFDRFSSTAHQVSDALQVIGTPVAREITAAPSKEAIIDYVRSNAFRYVGSRWLNDWVDLYTRPATQLSTLDDVDVLASGDSVLGWTMSNVLRRSHFEDEVESGLARLAGSAKSTAVRWRAVHALGADPTMAAADTLLKALDEDGSTWVRYGSIRSLIEIALLSQDRRGPILDELARRVPVLRTSSQLTKELERVLLPTAPPSGWSEDTATLVETLWAESTSVEEQDRWRKLGALIRVLPIPISR